MCYKNEGIRVVSEGMGQWQPFYSHEEEVSGSHEGVGKICHGLRGGGVEVIKGFISVVKFYNNLRCAAFCAVQRFPGFYSWMDSTSSMFFSWPFSIELTSLAKPPVRGRRDSRTMPVMLRPLLNIISSSSRERPMVSG